MGERLAQERTDEGELFGVDPELGHAIFLDHHSWITWHSKTDLGLIAESGASVAHCPLVFSRYGQMPRSNVISATRLIAST